MSGEVLRCTTQSGSVYEIDRLHNMVRTIKKATPPGGHQGKRLPDPIDSPEEEWKPYESLNYFGVGHPLFFWWGTGRDARSDELGTPEGPVSRATCTSAVVTEEIE